MYIVPIYIVKVTVNLPGTHSFIFTIICGFFYYYYYIINMQQTKGRLLHTLFSPWLANSPNYYNTNY
jgi:hypothetical protein